MTFCVSKIESGGIFSYIKVEKNDFPIREHLEQIQQFNY